MRQFKPVREGQQGTGAAREEAAGRDAQAHAAMQGYMQSLAGHTVQPGDSLYQIAVKHLGDGKRWPEIAQLNDVSPESLRPGQVLRIPRQTAAPKAAAAPVETAAEKPKPKKEKAEAAGGATLGSIAEFIAHWEGFRADAYRDRGQWTIGYGTRIDAHVTEKYGVTVGTPVSEKTARRMLAEDAQGSLAVAQEFAPNFAQLPADVQLIVVDLAYNLGDRGIFKFKNFRAAVRAMDWGRAADELVDSEWYGQVGRRSKHHVETLRGLAR